MAISAKHPSGPVLLRMPDAASDVDLVGRAAKGDRWSREVLYRRHSAYLLGLAARLLANRGEAEEIVQDTFLAAFERLHTLREPAALRVWLGQIAVNRIRHRLRRVRLMRMVGLDRGADDATLESLAAPDTHPDLRGELALLDRALARLPADRRIAWMLRHVDDMELTEVAQVCGCSLATIKRRLAEADTVVRQHVSFKHSFDGDSRDGHPGDDGQDGESA